MCYCVIHFWFHDSLSNFKTNDNDIAIWTPKDIWNSWFYQTFQKEPKYKGVLKGLWIFSDNTTTQFFHCSKSFSIWNNESLIYWKKGFDKIFNILQRNGILMSSFKIISNSMSLFSVSVEAMSSFQIFHSFMSLHEIFMSCYIEGHVFIFYF